MRRLALILISLALLAGSVACAGDGRALRSPPAGATVPPTPSTAAVGNGSNANGSNTNAASGSDDAVVQTVAPGLLLASSAFADGDPIPVPFTCDAPSPASPGLAWTGLPEGTAELALTVVDPDAGDFVHWIVAGINPSVRSLGQGSVPEGAVELTNGAGTVGWTPPCPPPGAAPHRYIFTLYALGQPSGIVATTSARDALAALAADALDATILAATAQRA